MAKKKVIAVVKLQIRAGQATPAPPVGTALGQHGVNIMEFCRQYNEQTQAQAGQVIPAELTIYEDRSFTFITKQPPAAELIKQAGGRRDRAFQPRGASSHGRSSAIAEQKMKDLNANDVEQAMKIIAGTARSMGVEVGA
jgi:large subunit ribosomal protein L11